MSDPCTLCHLHEKLLRWSICEYCKRDIEDRGGSLLKYRDFSQELSPSLSSQSTREVPAQNRTSKRVKSQKQKTEAPLPTAQIETNMVSGMSAKMKSDVEKAREKSYTVFENLHTDEVKLKERKHFPLTQTSYGKEGSGMSANLKKIAENVVPTEPKKKFLTNLKVCKKCGNLYHPWGGNQQTCDDCKRTQKTPEVTELKPSNCFHHNKKQPCPECDKEMLSRRVKAIELLHDPDRKLVEEWRGREKSKETGTMEQGKKAGDAKEVKGMVKTEASVYEKKLSDKAHSELLVMQDIITKYHKYLSPEGKAYVKARL